MKRKILAALIAVMMVVTMLPLSVMAAEVIVEVSSEAELNAELAKLNDNTNVVIVKLTKDIQVTEAIVVNRTNKSSVFINLNGFTLSNAETNTIEAKEAVLWIQSGNIDVTNGTIKYTGTAAPAIRVGISNEANDAATLRAGLAENVTVESTTWGVVVVAGELNTYADINADSFAISGNGNPENKGTEINVLGGTVKSDVTAIYHPQAGTLLIANATVEGTEAVGIKAGTLTVRNAELIANGEYNANPAINNNGINTTGSVIAVEANPSYDGDVEITIEGSETVLTSKNGHIIHEYSSADAEGGYAVLGVEIEDGVFKSEENALNLLGEYPNVDVQGGDFGEDDSIKPFVRSYDVRFDLNGGTLVSGELTGKTITTATPYGELPVVEKEGYTFIGWSIRFDPNYGEKEPEGDVAEASGFAVLFGEGDFTIEGEETKEYAYTSYCIDEDDIVSITPAMCEFVGNNAVVVLRAEWEEVEEEPKPEKPEPKFDMPRLNLRSIVIDTTEGGKTNVASGRCYGALGSTHRLTLTPDEGYEIGEVLVNGKPVEVSKKGNISFVVKGNTYVEVEFVEIED